jgi:phosphate transport system permease protein
VNRFLRTGDPFVWLTGGALTTGLLMVAALLTLLASQSLGYFWPSALRLVRLDDGKEFLGEVRDREALPDDPEATRIQFQVANRDVYGLDFRWVDAARIAAMSEPATAIVLERREWGKLFGFVAEVRDGDTVVASGPEEAWRALQARLPAAQALAARIERIEKGEIGGINYEIESARLTMKRLAREDAGEDAIAAEQGRVAEMETRYDTVRQELDELTQGSRKQRVLMRTAEGREIEVPLTQIVRAFAPNAMGTVQKATLYASRMWEFVSANPRESNTEGGVFPAIFGTVMMVILMSIAVVPFGVLAALYLREYARQGVLVRGVRIAVNNLAGVPSIVFGVFGLGFFVYTLGGGVDALFFADRLPTPTFGTGGILWASLTLALLTVPVVVVATEEALAAVPKENREGSLALGATKLQTIWRVVLPNALPGILTGMILAMARGAGEVAPLMITGVVKLAPDLPLDWHWPFLHLERKFMHLGFHIYDVGFQSPNVEAAKPMVYATALLLVGIILILNLAAMLLRNRLRRRYAGATF